MRFLIFILIFAAAGCTEEEPAREHKKIYGGKLSSMVSALPKPHQYRVEVTWAGVPMAGNILKRISVDGSEKTLLEVSSRDGSFIDSEIKEGGYYRYQVSSAPGFSGLETEAVIPRDFDTDEHPPHRDLVLKEFNRVYVGKVTQHRLVSITAHEVIAKPDAFIDTSAPQTVSAEPGMQGAEGQPIQIETDRLSGALRLQSIGQPGSPGTRDAQGNIVKTDGVRGKSGKLHAVIHEKGDFEISVRVRNTAFGYSDPSLQSPCGAVGLFAAAEVNFALGDCRVIGTTMEGIYALGTDTIFLPPAFFQMKFESRKGELVVKGMGTPSAWEEGAVFGLRAQGPSAPIARIWGRIIGGETVWAKAVPKVAMQESHYEAWRFQEEVLLLRQSILQNRLNTWIDFENDVPLKVHQTAPIRLIQGLRRFAQELADALTERGLMGIAFIASPNSSINEANMWVTVRGNQTVSAERFLEKLRSGAYQKASTP